MPEKIGDGLELSASGVHGGVLHGCSCPESSGLLCVCACVLACTRM